MKLIRIMAGLYRTEKSEYRVSRLCNRWTVYWKSGLFATPHNAEFRTLDDCRKFITKRESS